MVRYKVKKFLMASTSSLHAGLPMPFTEDALVIRPMRRQSWRPNHLPTSGIIFTVLTSQFYYTSPFMDQQGVRTWLPFGCPNGFVGKYRSRCMVMGLRLVILPTQTILSVGHWLPSLLWAMRLSIKEEATRREYQQHDFDLGTTLGEICSCESTAPSHSRYAGHCGQCRQSGCAS